MKIIDSKLRIHERIISKKWGEEIIIHNDNDYCGKILRFNAKSRFSMHFHVKKKETLYVSKGNFVLTYIDTNTAKEHRKTLCVGDIIEIPQGQPHQLYSGTEGEIYEVSTQHFETDSYIIKKGDS